MYRFLDVGLYRTSRTVRKFSKFSKAGLFQNWTFFFPDTGLFTLEKRIANQPAILKQKGDRSTRVQIWVGKTLWKRFLMYRFLDEVTLCRHNVLYD